MPLLFLLASMNLAGSVCPAAAQAPSVTMRPQAFTDSDNARVAPSITSQPISQTVNTGQSATFIVVGTGTPPLAYQWMMNGAAIAGATSPAYTTPAAAISDNGAQFSVTISNPMGSTSSSSATLTVSGFSRPERSPRSASLKNQQVRTSRFVANSYVGVQSGYISYRFSNAQLLPGFQAQSVQNVHLATRFVLFGHEFNKYLSGQVTELVPEHEVAYVNVNGDMAGHTIWMNNIAGFTVKARLPVSKKWSLFGEGGVGVITRNGFQVNQAQAANSANYATFLFGGGLDYRVKDNWDVLTGVTIAPGRDKQPTTVFFSGGFDYTLRRVPAERAGADSGSAPIWPKNIIQVGYVTDALGFSVNDFFTTGKVPIFWHGSIEVANGLSANYKQNLFHTRRFFAIDWGADISSWKSRKNGDRFYTVSLFPVARIPLVRTNPVEFYVSYSLAGPSLITRTNIDGQNTGKQFTFQDYMSSGIYLGRKRRVTAEVRITHYSNANLFTDNPGITVPLGFYFGSTF